MSFKAQVKTAPGLIIEVTGETQKELFKAIAGAQEVFSEKACGLCDGTDILYKNRVVGKKAFNYYEAQCRTCGARLSFGQSTDEISLFAKRRLMANGEPTNDKKEGGFGNHNGWTHFKGDPDES